MECVHIQPFDLCEYELERRDYFREKKKSSSVTGKSVGSTNSNAC